MRSSRRPDVAARRLGALLAAPAALAVVVGSDAAQALHRWSIPVTGLLDEPAHFATAWLVLAAVLPPNRPGSVVHRFWLWTLVGSVALDVDHIPLYLWGGPVARPGGRPVSHSLVTVAVLLGLAAYRRWRTPLLGLAFGVLLHLARDVANGPGVPLVWPLSDVGVRTSEAAYLAALAVVTGAVLWRRRAGPAVSLG